MVIYQTGAAASFDDVVNAIEAAASLAGWNTSIGDTADGGNPNDVGRTLELDWGADYFVTVRSAVDVSDLTVPEAGGVGANISSPGMFCFMEHIGGSESHGKPAGYWNSTNYIGPAVYRAVDLSPPAEPLEDGWVAPVFPVTYHIYVYENPDMLLCVVQTGPVRYQWMMFGEIEKFGDWQGGGFYGAIGTPKSTTGGNFSSQPSYSLNGSSNNRGFGPWHRVDTRFNPNEQAYTVTNTHLHIRTGTSETEIDDPPYWGFNSGDDPGTLGGGARLRREVVANIHWSPLSLRSPNNFNQVSVMVPYWLSTQRESHRVLIGRQPHMRHIPIDNFNPGDTFELGNDVWQVWPYFEREGLTGLEGFACKQSEGSS